MKPGDLVKHAEGKFHGALYLESWIGIVLGFDEDNDPIIQWFLAGSAICREAEYRKDIKVC